MLESYKDVFGPWLLRQDKQAVSGRGVAGSTIHEKKKKKETVKVVWGVSTSVPSNVLPTHLPSFNCGMKWRSAH